MNRPTHKARAVAIAKAREDLNKVIFRTAMLGMGASLLVYAVALLAR
ncbi:hypothetical protein [Rhizobium paknamense]|uniref:Uncharacterized protein n=1 Tax=Rhizobium paknamense TaxID=1206817 RepID=A0ABU0IIQ1_9HYPH|nr:hypothetical protein [Rhizobium paknamense]MDQ0458134.1 hypothetical protein [Rhizobium paknamense]